MADTIVLTNQCADWPSKLASCTILLAAGFTQRLNS